LQVLKFSLSYRFTAQSGYKQVTLQLFCLNPLTPNSDENEISLYIITTYSNIQVMRKKEVITNDKMS